MYVHVHKAGFARKISAEIHHSLLSSLPHYNNIMHYNIYNALLGFLSIGELRFTYNIYGIFTMHKL